MKPELFILLPAVLLFSITAAAQDKVVVIPLANSGPKAPVAKTGQTQSYHVKDDGALQTGVAAPDPRFVDNGDGTVTDRLTGLIWLQETHCTRYYPLDFSGQYPRPWTSAIAACNGLRSGYCGLADGSEAGDWRMPNVRELASLLDYGRHHPALPPSFPRSDSAAVYTLDTIWTSTTYDIVTGNPAGDAWYIDFFNGNDGFRDKEQVNGIWPVRGGR